MISIVSPIYNEADSLIELCQRISKACENANENYEIVLVENGSWDASLDIIRKLNAEDPRIKYVSLSRNFGHQGGILAGITKASGDAVVSIDGDLQQPPELITKMIELWKEGNDVVYTRKKPKNKEKNLRFYLRKLFYKLIGKISNLKLTYGQSDFRLLDRKIVDTILSIPERNLFLRGLVDWVGFKQIGIDYEIDLRKSGESKFSLFNYISFAFDGVFSFSTVPLKLFLWLGVFIAGLCTVYGIYLSILGVVNVFLSNRLSLPPGWATLSVSISFVSAVQLIGIGCLGEYIGRIFLQTKSRPNFIVKEQANGVK